MIKEIDREEMERLLLEEEGLLVDVREDEEVDEGAIEGFVHMPLSRFEEFRDQIPPAKPIIFYCRSGRRSLKTAEIAEEWTDQPLYSLAGGYLGYISEEE